MSLNRYHNSRSSDNVFKLLHEETTYLDILKGNVKSVYKNEMGEDKAVRSHDTVRQQLLQEQDPGIDKMKEVKPPEEQKGTPEEQEKAVGQAAEKAPEVDKEMGVGESFTTVKSKLREISIAVARQAAGRLAKQKAMATKGLLRSKEMTKKIAKKKGFTPGLRG